MRTLVSTLAVMILGLGLGGCNRHDISGIPLPKETGFDHDAQQRRDYLDAFRDGYRSGVAGVRSHSVQYDPIMDGARAYGFADGQNAGLTAYLCFQVEVKSGVPMPTRTPFDADAKQRQDYLDAFRDSYRRSAVGDDRLAIFSDRPRQDGYQSARPFGWDAYLRSRRSSDEKHLPLRTLGVRERPFAKFREDFTNRVPGGEIDSWSIGPWHPTNIVWCSVEYKLPGSTNLLQKEYSYLRTNGTTWKLLWDTNITQ